MALKDFSSDDDMIYHHTKSRITTFKDEKTILFTIYLIFWKL